MSALDGHRAWGLLGRALCGERGGLAVGTAGAIVWMLAAAAAPVVLGRAVDAGLAEGNGDGLAGWLLALVALGAVEGAAGMVRHHYAIRNGTRAAAAMRGRLIARVHALDARARARFESGDLLTRATSDATWVGLFVDFAAHTIGFVVGVVFAAVFLIATSPLLAVAVLGPLPLISLAMWRSSDAYRRRSHALQEALSDATTLTSETVTGIRVVKGLGAEDAQRARFDRLACHVRDRGLHVARLDAVFEPIVETLPALGVLAVILLGGHLAAADQVSVGDLVAAYAYVMLLVKPLRILGTRVSTIQRALAAADRLSELLDSRPALPEPGHPVPLPAVVPGRATGEVRFESVRFAYRPGGVRVLDGLDLVLPPGSRTALIGATGSGKSTVALLLARDYDVEAGRVLIDGVDVRDVRLSDLRRAVTVVSASAFLFADTVRTNIAYAEPRASGAAIERAARIAGAHDFIQRLPQGYETCLGERGITLSGGQRQRLALARALVSQARVLVLDDATSALDAITERAVLQRLVEVLDTRALLLITSRPAAIALANRAVLLRSGCVAAAGAPTDLLRASAHFREVLLGTAARARHASASTAGTGE